MEFCGEAISYFPQVGELCIVGAGCFVGKLKEIASETLLQLVDAKVDGWDGENRYFFCFGAFTSKSIGGSKSNGIGTWSCNR